MKHILIACFLFFNASKANAWNLGLSKSKAFNLDESYVEWRKYENWRNLNTPGKDDWDWTAEFHNTVSLWNRLYWKSNYHMSMDSTQIRYVGLEYYLGLKLTNWMHAIKYHHSQHCADLDCGQWPVEDSYGARLIFKGF